jgi:hypothetical protein
MREIDLVMAISQCVDLQKQITGLNNAMNAGERELLTQIHGGLTKTENSVTVGNI